MLPTPETVVEQQVANGLMTKEDAQRYLRNYWYFKSRREEIERLFQDRIVASVNGAIFVAYHLSVLKDMIKHEPHCDRGYIKEICSLF